MLEVGELSVRFDGVEALRSVSMTVPEGGRVAVIGPNGAGKSSLMNLLAGVGGKSSGRAEFNGRNLIGQTPEKIVSMGIALVPEGRRIFGPLSVEENLLVSLPKADSSRRSERLEWAFELFPDVARHRHDPARELSGGEQQQLAIARALLTNPSLLMLDEPSFGLAPKVVEMVMDALGRIHGEGTSILLVEQNIGEALEFADHVYVLSNGRVQAEGSASDLRQQRDMISNLYFGGV